jgi:hypothetical protein
MIRWRRWIAPLLRPLANWESLSSKQPPWLRGKGANAAEGTTNQEIAERLVISLTIVKKYVSSLFLYTARPGDNGSLSLDTVVFTMVFLKRRIPW